MSNGMIYVVPTAYHNFSDQKKEVKLEVASQQDNKVLDV